MKKQAVSLCAVLLTALFLLLPAAAFSDIQDDEVSAAAETLAALNIVSGFEDGNFRPSSPLTRAQFAKLGVLSLGAEDKVVLYRGYTIFPDVKTGHWAVGYVNVAVRESHLLTGYPDGTFRPDTPITEAEAVTICLRMLGYQEADIGSFWPADYLTKAAEIGLTDGMTISASSAMNRGNAARLLANLLVTENKEGEPFSLHMGLIGTENVTLLATEKTDLSLAQGIISLSIGGAKTQMSTVNTMPASLVGSRGVLLTGRDGKVCGFVPYRYDSVSVTIRSRDADGITTTEGGRILIPAETEVILRGGVAPYGSAYVDLRTGTTVQVCYDRNGKLSHIATASVSGAVGEMHVLKADYSGSQHPLHAFYDAALVRQSPIYKNGLPVDASALRVNDVVTYSADQGRFLVSDLRLSGVISAAYPSKTRAQSFTLLGNTFSISDNREMNLSAFDKTTVTVLLAPDGTAAEVVPSSKVSAAMGGLVSSAGGTSARVQLWSGYEISGETARDYSDLSERYVEVSVASDGKMSLREPVYRAAAESFSISSMKLGRTPVASDVVLYECAERSAGFRKFDLDEILDTMQEIPSGRILYTATDSTGTVRAMVLQNATGNAFVYGVIGVNGEDEDTFYTLRTDQGAGSGGVSEVSISAQGGVALNVNGLYGGLAVSGGYARAYCKLENRGSVSLDAFDGTDRVQLDSGIAPLSKTVQVYNETTGRFITLAQAKREFSSFRIYTDAVAGVVRMIVVA